jgi:MFS family permease
MRDLQKNDAVAPTTAAPHSAGAGHVGSVAFVTALSLVAAVGGFLFGFDSGVINGAVDAIGEAFGTRAAGTGFAVASVLLGCAVGAFLAGALADFMGRRPTMLLNAALFLVSAFITGAAGSADVFIAGRLLGGLAIGAASVLAPMYISEVAPARLRGRLASLQQLAIVLGLFMAFLSNYLIARAAGDASSPFWLGAPAWRWMFWMEAVPAAAFLTGILLIPESPRFLVASGYQDFGTQVFGAKAASLGFVPRVRDDNYGFYGLFDQVVFAFSSPDERILRGIGVTGCVQAAPLQDRSQMPMFIEAAILARGIFRSRPRDVAGFGVFYGHFSSDLRSAERLAQGLDPTVGVKQEETVLEWNYTFRFKNAAFFVEPDLQYIIRPGGTGQIPDALVVGAQVGINF